MIPRPLVIGYGNRLRGDDAVGWVVADSLANDPRMDGVDVVAVHQLTPDLVHEVSRASRVVFVDAVLDPTVQPGIVAVATLEPEPDAEPMTHHVGAGTILSLAEALYGASPVAFTVTVAIESTEPGAAIGDAVRESVATLVDTVVGLCREVSCA